jgi:hypothetical protein
MHYTSDIICKAIGTKIAIVGTLETMQYVHFSNTFLTQMGGKKKYPANINKY